MRVPEEEEGVAWRRIPDPDSEVMVVSADGVMVHLRDEGWKEAKVASVSAAPVCEAGQKAERELRLEKHSYRAGLWDAKRFTNHYWAESYRRGVEKAKTGRLHQRWRYLDLDDGLRLFSPPHRNSRLVAHAPIRLAASSRSAGSRLSRGLCLG